MMSFKPGVKVIYNGGKENCRLKIGHTYTISHNLITREGISIKLSEAEGDFPIVFFTSYENLKLDITKI